MAVKAHNDGAAMLNTLETFGIFQHNLYWSLPVSIRVSFEIYPVSLLDLAKVGVNSLSEGPPDDLVIFGSNKGLPGCHSHAVVPCPGCLAICYLLICPWVVVHQGGVAGDPPEHNLKRHEAIDVLDGVCSLHHPSEGDLRPKITIVISQTNQWSVPKAVTLCR